MAKLLTKREYLDLLDEPRKVELDPSEEKRALVHATRVWKSLELTPRTLRPKDVTVTYETRGVRLVHVRAYPRRRPDTFVIVVLAGKKVRGHILFDIASEYSPLTFYARAGDDEYEGPASEELIRDYVPRLDPEDRYSFAILSAGEGSYMQTAPRGRGKFCLEYQLVNTSSHYETRSHLTLDEVLAALVSFGFGKNEWLDLSWRRLRFG